MERKLSEMSLEEDFTAENGKKAFALLSENTSHLT